MPKYSVVIPVRNWWNYIKLAIDSILSQTYNDFELIILYNKSSDNTLDIVKSYNDKRIKILESKEDLSIVENWWRIVNLELWEYLTISWHDDIFYPNFLEEINSLILKYPQATLYQTHFNLIDKDWNLIRKCHKIEKKETALDFVIKRSHNKRDSYGTWYVMKSNLYKQVWWIPHFESLFYADDALWVVLSSISCKATSQKTLFEYRKHMTSAAWKEIDLNRWILWLGQYLEYLKENKEKYNIDNKIIKIIEYKSNLWNSLYELENWNNLKALKYLKEANKIVGFLNFKKEKLEILILLILPLRLRKLLIDTWKKYFR